MKTDLVFVDTNVFLYARDNRYPEKQESASRWLDALAARDALVVSPQVLGEFYSVLLRGKVTVDVQTGQDLTVEMQLWSQGNTDLELIAQALAIHTETGFQWWDCLILGSAIRSGCSYLLSEDYQHGRTVRGTTIINPFVVGPEAITTEH